MVDDGSERTLELVVNGRPTVVPDTGGSLLDAVRDQLGLTGAKDGCSPQGQCGCCTVWVDGAPRVACVTPARRVRGRTITTVEGLESSRRTAWEAALVSAGASQCGFCTPGIVMRLEAMVADLAEGDGDTADRACRQAMLAHLCRCTGWQTISEAFVEIVAGATGPPPQHRPGAEQRQRRIRLEAGTDQVMNAGSALGAGGFAADTAPPEALVAVLDPSGDWVVGETLAEARRLAGKVQGRRTTVDPHYPVAVPDGAFVATLQTTWVDPAYLETDASWCVPGGEPATSLANGGAFGGKRTGTIERAARELADRHQRPVLALYSREDALRLGPKRPPLAAGVRADGSGVVRVARTPGVDAVVTAVAPAFALEEVDIAGPPTSVDLRGAVWAELAVLSSALTDGPVRLRGPSGSIVEAAAGPGGLEFEVAAGPVLDPIVLRSYCIGAAHMGWSWATSESLTVDSAGAIHDLTVRSLGVVRAIDTPPIRIVLRDDPTVPDPVNGSDAVFAAAAALAWRAHDFAPRFPLGSGQRLP